MSRVQKVAGVLGGMGPDATIDFMSKVVALTRSGRDQDHVRMLVDHNPHVPNRQEAILRNGEDPGPVLASMAAGLEANGAEFLVIPCNTAYVFQDAILAATGIPLVSIVDETIGAIREAGAIDSAGILATDGCLQAGIYQSGLDAAGMNAVLPSKSELTELMRLIKAIKAGVRDEAVSAAMAALATALVERGAGAVIAGCTEIPLVLEEKALDVPLISSTDVLARKTVQIALGNVPLPDR